MIVEMAPKATEPIAIATDMPMTETRDNPGYLASIRRPSFTSSHEMRIAPKIRGMRALGRVREFDKVVGSDDSGFMGSPYGLTPAMVSMIGAAGQILRGVNTEISDPSARNAELGGWRSISAIRSP